MGASVWEQSDALYRKPMASISSHEVGYVKQQLDAAASGYGSDEQELSDTIGL
jgi:hypothetical protein